MPESQGKVDQRGQCIGRFYTAHPSQGEK